MNEITCDVCMDLIPLVQDGIASEESKKAVLQHVGTCEVCATFYDGEIPPAINSDKIILKVKRKIQFFTTLFMLFGIFFGVGLTGESDMFYNTLIMPAIGICGYMIFRWKALYKVPLLIVVMNGCLFALNQLRGVGEGDWYSTFMFAIIYNIFVVAGVLIAGLLHFVFRKE